MTDSELNSVQRAESEFLVLHSALDHRLLGVQGSACGQIIDAWLAESLVSHPHLEPSLRNHASYSRMLVLKNLQLADSPISIQNSTVQLGTGHVSATGTAEVLNQSSKQTLGSRGGETPQQLSKSTSASAVTAWIVAGIVGLVCGWWLAPADWPYCSGSLRTVSTGVVLGAALVLALSGWVEFRRTNWLALNLSGVATLIVARVFLPLVNGEAEIGQVETEAGITAWISWYAGTADGDLVFACHLAFAAFLYYLAYRVFMQQTGASGRIQE